MEGYDACRKIAILSSLISGQQVDFEDIYCEGITEITVEDMKYAKAMVPPSSCWLPARDMQATVCMRSWRLACSIPSIRFIMLMACSIPYSYTAMFWRCHVLWKRRGKLPTASAVVADVVDAAKHLNRNIMTMWKQEKLHLEDKADSKRRFFIRMKGDAQEMLPALQDSFGDIKIIRADGLEGEFGFTTPVMMEGDYDTRANIYKDQILHMIRIEDQKE